MKFLVSYIGRDGLPAFNIYNDEASARQAGVSFSSQGATAIRMWRLAGEYIYVGQWREKQTGTALADTTVAEAVPTEPTV